MAQITITIPQADVADVAETYGVNTVSEFKAILVEEIKTRVRVYKDRKQKEALSQPTAPDIT